MIARCLSILLFVAVAPLLASAEDLTPIPALGVGDAWVPIEVEDQHGEKVVIGYDTRLVLFAADMDGADLVGKALEDESLHDLAAHGTVFVSDISRMPGLVTRLFALPSMRRRPYRMLLDQGPGPTLELPRDEGAVTAILLSDERIQSIVYLREADAVAKYIRGEQGEG